MFARRTVLLILGGTLAMLAGFSPSLGSRAEAAALPLTMKLTVPGGPRETGVLLRVNLNSKGKHAPGVPVVFFEEFNGRIRNIGTVFSDGSGNARLNYRIPKATKKDNVFIIAVSGGSTYRNVSVKQRVRIG